MLINTKSVRNVHTATCTKVTLRMQTLLELFSEQEQRFASLGVRDLHKLKYVFDATRDEDAPADYEQLKFELQTIFRLIESLEPREMRVTIDNTFKKLERLEFNPTISGPNITFKDKLRRDYSVWYKPVFYVPTANSAQPLTVDFVILRSFNLSMYWIDPELRKQLYHYEFLPNTLLRDISVRLLGKMRPVQAIVTCKREFRPSHLADLKAANYYLKPSRNLAVSQGTMPEAVKINLPINTMFADNLTPETRKFEELNRIF